MDDEPIKRWLGPSLEKHKGLTDAVVALLRNMISVKQIEFLSIEGRVKSIESALEKVKRKKYRKPKDQLTDLSGIKIITYLESDGLLAANLVKELFDVDAANSLDRSAILGSDRIGYRSTHFVCTLGSSRGRLPEYSDFADLKFEVQIRSVLQHAWAELAHDRSFKFGPGLPANIQRKLNLYAGMLEIVDSSFDSIAKEIDEYAESLESKTVEQIEELEVSTLALDKLISEIVKKHSLPVSAVPVISDVIPELKAFGIRKTGDVNKLVSSKLVQAYKKVPRKDTPTGFLRMAMMVEDLEKYLGIPTSWNVIDTADVRRLGTKYGLKKARAALENHGKDIIDEEDVLKISPAARLSLNKLGKQVRPTRKLSKQFGTSAQCPSSAIHGHLLHA